MGKTLNAILTWADEVIPNKVSTTSKITFLSDLLGDGDFRKYDDTELVYNFQVTTGSADYDLPTKITISDLTYVGISGTTYNATNVIGSTTPFTEYLYVGRYDEGAGYTEYTSKLKFTPKPTGSYHAMLKYKPFYGPYSATSDTTTILNANNNLINYLQNKLAARICQSMAFPRIDLANNFEISAMESLSNAKTNYYRVKRRKSHKNISYKGWW